MTRYSASRGIMYSAPPGPSGDQTAESDATADAQREEPTAETTGTDAEAKADD